MIISKLQKNTMFISLLAIPWFSMAMDENLYDEAHGRGEIRRPTFAEIKGEIAPVVNVFVDTYQETVRVAKAIRDQVRDNANSDQKSIDKSFDEVRPNDSSPVVNDSNYFPIRWLTKKDALKFGMGAVVAVAVCGAVYVLYKNGTIKKFAHTVVEYKRTVIGTVITGTAAIAGSLLLYNWYTQNSEPTELEKHVVMHNHFPSVAQNTP